MSFETLQINYSNEIENSEVTLEDLNEDGNDLSCFHVLEILNCPTTKSAANFITSNTFYESLFARRMKFIALRLKIENDLDSNDIIIPKTGFFNERKKFIVTYEAKDKTAILWKNQFDKEFMKFDLIISDEENPIELFAVEFMTEKMKENGGQVKSSSKMIKLSSIIDQNDNSLLAHAVKKRNLKIIQKLLKLSFDANEKYETKRLVDIAWENDDQDIVFELLKANSYYPENFNESKANGEIQKFIQNSKKLHTAIKENDQEEVKEILENNKKLRHFFTTSNISALNFALKCENFEIYKILYKESKIFGPNEKFDKSLNEEFYKRISKLNSDLSLHLPVSHISILLSKTFVPPCDDLTEKLQSVQAAFEKINQIPEVNLMLQVLATNSNLKIHFDFTQESVIYMDPTNRNTNIKGCYDHENNHLHIAALELLNETTEHITHATISHESSHCVLDMIFRNKRFPFAINDAENKEKYMEILSEIEKDYGKNSNNCNKENEQIIEDVFISDKSDENSKIRELIARVPDLLAFYQGNKEKFDQIKTEFKNLFDYWTEIIMPAMNDALPVHQKLSDYSIEINYDDLTKPFQAAIKYSFIDFQGQNVRLFEIIGEESKTFHTLKSKQIRKILDGKKYKIKGMELICDNYIERSFKGNSMFENDVFSRFIEKVKNIETIMTEFYETKIFLLSDHAGAGKSTTCKYLTIKLKEKFPSYYVSYIDLKKYIKIYEESDLNEIISFLIKILKIKNDLELKVFKELFECDKVILIYDGIDEIAPKFKDFILNLINKIKETSKNMQFIATRPQHSKEIEKKFQIITHKLMLLNDKEIEEIVRKNLNSNKNNDKVLKEVKSFVVRFNLNNNPLVITMITELYSKGKISKENFNLYSLYNEMIELKKEIKAEKGELVNRDSDIDSKVSIWEIHQFYAVDLILKGLCNSYYRNYKINFEDLQLFKKYKKDKQKFTPEKISRYGLLIIDHWDTKNEFPDFVHRTFAEFFVAKFLIQNIQEAIEADIGEISEKEFLLRMEILQILIEWNMDNSMNYVYNFTTDFLNSEKVKIRLGERFLQFLEQGDTQKFITKMINHETFRENFKSLTRNFSTSLKIIETNERYAKSIFLSKKHHNELTLFQKVLIGHDWGYDEKNLLTSVLNLFDFLMKSNFKNWHHYTGFGEEFSESEFYKILGITSEAFSKDHTINPSAKLDLIKDFNQNQIKLIDERKFYVTNDDEKKKMCLEEIEKIEKFSNLLAFINIGFIDFNDKNFIRFIKTNLMSIINWSVRSETLTDQVFELFEKVFENRKDEIFKSLDNGLKCIFNSFPSREFEIDSKFAKNLDHFFMSLAKFFNFTESSCENVFFDDYNEISIFFLSIVLNLEETMKFYENKFDTEELRAIFSRECAGKSRFLHSKINFERFNLFCDKYFYKNIFKTVFNYTDDYGGIISLIDAYLDIYRENFIEHTGYKILNKETFLVNDLSYDFYDSDLINFLYFLEHAEIPKEDLQNYYYKSFPRYYHRTSNVLDKALQVFVNKFKEIGKSEVKVISILMKRTNLSEVKFEVLKPSFEIIEKLLENDEEKMRHILLIGSGWIHPLIKAVVENWIEIIKVYEKFLTFEEIFEILLTQSISHHYRFETFTLDNFRRYFQRFLPFTNLLNEFLQENNLNTETTTEKHILAYELLNFVNRIQVPEKIIEEFLYKVLKEEKLSINFNLINLNEDVKKIIQKFK